MMTLAAGSRARRAMRLPWVALCFLASPPLLWSGVALASDGAVELSPAAAVAGGVTPGDTPGFPISITKGGHYVLTAGLGVPDAATTAIEVLADGVVIDLNGFALTGPALCGGDPVVCSPAGSGIGIVSANSGVSVLNGSVTGMGDGGVVLGPLARVAGLVVSLNAGAGMTVGVGGEIRESRVELNGGVGIAAGDGSLVIDNVVRGNLGLGLSLGSDAGYANNVFSDNAPPEIVGGTELGTNACPAVGAGCPAPQIDCGGLCFDTSVDEANCGSCDNACGAGESCIASSCTLTCPAGLSNCGGACVDTLSDEEHCGACDNPCAAGHLCSSGACQLSCQAGLSNCSGTCVNLVSDEDNCGFCGSACGAGLLCTGGTCSTP